MKELELQGKSKPKSLPMDSTIFFVCARNESSGETVRMRGRCSHYVTNVEKSQICALAATNSH